MPLPQHLATALILVAAAFTVTAPAAAAPPTPRTETRHFTPAAFAPDQVRVATPRRCSAPAWRI